MHALGLKSVAAVVGHDFGAMVAAWSALVRPDVFQSLVLMSAPFAGPSALTAEAGVPSTERINAELGTLTPPRRHYQWYYGTREADADMHRCPQGVNAFLRANYHHKSADWAGNKPFPLASWAPQEIARMPSYYIMERDKDMAATVASEMPSTPCAWLTSEELRVYSTEFERTGFQGGLNWYRCRLGGRFTPEQQLYSGRTIDVPSCFIAGRSDWGVYQRPGDLARMQEKACSRMRSRTLVEGAGHWVLQEQPEETTRLLLQFLKTGVAD